MGSKKMLLGLIISDGKSSKKFWIIPSVPSTLKVKKWTENCQFCLFMICMVNDGFFWKPLLKMLDLLK